MKRVIIFFVVIIIFNLSLAPTWAVDMPDNWQSATADSPAEELKVDTYNLFIDKPTLARGYTAEVFDGNFWVGILPKF